MDMQSGKPTEVNPNALPHKPTGNAPLTEVNPAVAPIHSKATVINPSVFSLGGPQDFHTRLPASHGTDKNIGLVLDGYRLVSVMATASGEADLYVCEDGLDKKYCLKHFKRFDAVSKEVHGALMELEEPYVAKLVSWGYWDERIYEVWPFFTNGSLLGQRPDALTLKRYVKQMNEAVAAMHSHGLIHQDIKSANFMIDDNGDIALIDFGTSAIIGGGTDQRTHVTKIGQTTDYAAPEVLLSRFCWPASDYYSLGVTIYELLIGATPYANYDEDMLKRKLDDMRDTHVPNMDKLSKEYQDLITGLLWYDNKQRWGYEQVRDWLSGYYSKWVRTSVVSNYGSQHEKQFRFDGKVYYIPSQISQLVVHMAYKWDLGKHLFDGDGRFGLMSKKLEDMEGTEDLYAICNAPKAAYEDDDINYFRRLYQLAPELKLFAWRNWQFEDKKALGVAILNSLWSSEIDKTTNRHRTSASIFGEDTATASLPSRDEIAYWARNHIISKYLRFIGDDEIVNTISALEDHAQNDVLSCFRIAYKLSGSTELRLPSGKFANKAELLRFVEKKAQESDAAGGVDSFLQFCRSEIYDGQTVNVGFQAWMESLRLEKALRVLTDENFVLPAGMRKEIRVAEATSTPKHSSSASSAHTGVTRAKSKYKTLTCSKCEGRFSYPIVSYSNNSGGPRTLCPYCGADVSTE